MSVRRFTEAGIEAFSLYIQQAVQAAEEERDVAPFPVHQLEDPKLTSATPFILHPGSDTFVSRMNLGASLNQMLPGFVAREIMYDRGMWSWLAAKFFDNVTQNRTKVKKEREYVFGTKYSHFYRHVMFGPYFVFKSNHDCLRRCRVLLYDDPATMNEVATQLSSYQAFAQNPGLLWVVQSLYYDEASGRLKRGASTGKRKSKKTGKDVKVPGSARRLMDWFRQIELNYDMSLMSPHVFWELLPREFDKWKQTGLVTA